MKKITSFVLVMVLMLSLAACGSDKGASKGESKEKSFVEQIKEKGYLVMGTSADYPPYETHVIVDGKDEIVGFDIEIGKEIAKALGVELKIEDMEFDSLLVALSTGKVDMVIAGMSATEERAKNVDFSTVYYNPSQKIVIRKEDKAMLNTLEAFKGKVIGVQKGTIQEEFADENMGFATKVALGKIPILMVEVKTGKSDGLVLEEPVAEAYVAQNPELAISDIEVAISEDSGSSVAVKKGNKELLDVVNQTIKTLIDEKKIDQMVIEANKLLETE